MAGRREVRLSADCFCLHWFTYQQVYLLAVCEFDVFSRFKILYMYVLNELWHYPLFLFKNKGFSVFLFSVST